MPFQVESPTIHGLSYELRVFTELAEKEFCGQQTKAPAGRNVYRNANAPIIKPPVNAIRAFIPLISGGNVYCLIVQSLVSGILKSRKRMRNLLFTG